MAVTRVLIVEDDPVLAMHLETLVGELLDAEIAVATSIAEAEVAILAPLDLAILDVDVTDGKTYEIASSLADADVPFGFVSASNKEEIPRTLRGYPFVAKPYEDDAIGTLVAALLRRRPMS